MSSVTDARSIIIVIVVVVVIAIFVFVPVANFIPIVIFVVVAIAVADILACNYSCSHPPCGDDKAGGAGRGQWPCSMRPATSWPW